MLPWLDVSMAKMSLFVKAAMFYQLPNNRDANLPQEDLETPGAVAGMILYTQESMESWPPVAAGPGWAGGLQWELPRQDGCAKRTSPLPGHFQVSHLSRVMLPRVNFSWGHVASSPTSPV